MFDADYFRKTLPQDVSAMGGKPVVEMVLLSGHSYRVRSIIGVDDGRVTLEAFLVKADLAHHRPLFGGMEDELHERFRAVVSYDAIAAVILDPSETQVRVRPGFASG
jgi:hypothetical protein